MKFKFIHAADLHIDSQLHALEAYEGAPVERVRNATRDALERLVSLCFEHDAKFLIVAGDLFDHSWKDFNTALFVVKQFQKLDKAGIPVLVIRGNHDSKAEASLQAPWPKSDLFTLFDHRAGHTVYFQDLKVAVHGMSFPERHVKESLLKHYPAAEKGMLNIGVLHTNVIGARGSRDHEAYAPCSIPDLVAMGYQYWALGHVHEFEVLIDGPCHVVYSGNTQGRHIRETNAKGCAVVTVEEGAIEQVEFVPTDVLRWKELKLELEEKHGLDDLNELLETHLRREVGAAEGRLLGVRLHIHGECEAHAQLTNDAARREAEAGLRATAGEVSDDVWIEKIKWHTRPRRKRAELVQGQDFVGELLREFDRLEADPERLKEFTACLQSLVDKTQADLQPRRDEDDRTEPLIDFSDAVQIREWLKSAEGLLLNQFPTDG